MMGGRAGRRVAAPGGGGGSSVMMVAPPSSSRGAGGEGRAPPAARALAARLACRPAPRQESERCAYSILVVVLSL